MTSPIAEMPATLVPGAGRHRAAAGRDQQIVRLQCRRSAVWQLRLKSHAVGPRLGSGHLRAGEHLDSLFFERSFQLGGHGFVLDRNESRQELDDGDLTAEATEDGRELDADGAASENRD
jgi:hypothetical protein